MALSIRREQVERRATVRRAPRKIDGPMSDGPGRLDAKETASMRGDTEAVGAVIVTPVSGDWRGLITAGRRPGSAA